MRLTEKHVACLAYRNGGLIENGSLLKSRPNRSNFKKAAASCQKAKKENIRLVGEGQT